MYTCVDALAPTNKYEGWGQGRATAQKYLSLGMAWSQKYTQFGVLRLYCAVYAGVVWVGRVDCEVARPLLSRQVEESSGRADGLADGRESGRTSGRTGGREDGRAGGWADRRVYIPG